MLDLPRLERIQLTDKPIYQSLTAYVLIANYRWFPGVEIDFEDYDRVPDEKVIFAMNHTDRYNYFPFLTMMWSRHSRYMATWVKGKYYENAFVGGFMEKTNQLPTVSRGYIITMDFTKAVGRKPTDEEYSALRRWVDGTSLGPNPDVVPNFEKLPKNLLEQRRNVLGYEFDPKREDFAGYINSLFGIMMQRFVELNEGTSKANLDLLIFPQGTRSVRLLPSHIGISQIALHLKRPIVPVGCNGSDLLHPGASPLAKKGRVVYRFGEPMRYEDLADFHIDEPYAPFSADAEHRYKAEFEGLAGRVTGRIDELLDPEYQRSETGGADATKGTDRFV